MDIYILNTLKKNIYIYILYIIMTLCTTISNKHLKAFLEDVLKIGIVSIGPNILKKYINKNNKFNINNELDNFIWLVAAIAVYHVISVNLLNKYIYYL